MNHKRRMEQLPGHLARSAVKPPARDANSDLKTGACGDFEPETATGRSAPDHRRVENPSMVNCAPDFNRQPDVISGFSDVILGVFGREIGRHCRSAVGMVSLPFDVAVKVEGEVEIDG